MAPPRWTTQEQHEFLSSKLEQFTQSQLTKRVAAFLASIQSEWTEKWPVEKAIVGDDGPSNKADMTEDQREAIDKAYSKLEDVCILTSSPLLDYSFISLSLSGWSNGFTTRNVNRAERLNAVSTSS